MRTEDGQHVASVLSASGHEVSVIIAQPAGIDFHPLPGDQVMFSRVGSRYEATGIYSEDAKTEAGEWLTFSRNDLGAVVASVHLTKTGEVLVDPSAVMKVANGLDFVALATPTDNMWTALKAALDAFPGGAPDGGAALAAAMSTAIGIAQAANTIPATKLKTD